ncbi:MAG: efflux RND transporter periplasmic adaptor subunit [Proteobacteria bacterium]|nr:efflux RND transporter periplasmic adaptor subunit [Pseudomonadota bacterium]
MIRILRSLTLVVAVLLLLAVTGHAETDKDKKGEKRSGGPPPARVVTTVATVAMVAPEAEYIGTVFFQEVSDIASEVKGRIETVNFEEGQRVGAGTKLIQIDSEILASSLMATRATYGQVGANLEKARIDFKRIMRLYEKQLASGKDYDEYRFRVKVLEKQLASLRAEVAQIKAELNKKSIRAPFGGVILKKHVDRGEWLSPGSPVATLAKDDIVEIVVNVPENVVAHSSVGMVVEIDVAGRSIKGVVAAIIPRGDVATRTFPVKIRVDNRYNLIEGMAAKVRLPRDERIEATVVDRDAVINSRGKMVLWTVKGGKAVMVPVKVIGYDGSMAGVSGAGLGKGAVVVIKGNERLRPGQAVAVVGEGGEPKEPTDKSGKPVKPKQ